VFDNQEKSAIVRRAVCGAAAAGCTQFFYHDDAHGIARTALAEVGDVCATAIDSTQMSNALDTISAARALRDQACDVVITLGGDGTNRAFCLGWQDAPLLPISTGTNNVFPGLQEATIAGAAAALAALGVAPDVAFEQQKCITVEIEGQRPDLALIDVVMTSERFVGARALLKPQYFQSALLTRADPAAVGITSIGGLLSPLSAATDAGLWMEFGEPGTRIAAPLAPGLYHEVCIRSHRTLELGQTVRAVGPGTLAFDGERERTLAPGQEARMTLSRTGPWVVNVTAVMHRAAELGCFRR
jgi:predicted polyphosphate/ATP-dependent NAD kinase